MIFRQLFETDSSTYTYLVADPDNGEAILIDPVMDTVERDLQVLKDLNLTLNATLETHVHADHLTGALKLKNQTGCKIAYPAMVQSSCIDIGIREGEAFKVGNVELNPLFTPGHTDHHHAYLVDTPVSKMLFTGDAQRNCISNVQPRGLEFAEASQCLLWLIMELSRRGLPDVEPKDDSQVEQLDYDRSRNLLVD